MYSSTLVYFAGFFIIVHCIQHTQLNDENLENESSTKPNHPVIDNQHRQNQLASPPQQEELAEECRRTNTSDVACVNLPAFCFQCNFTYNCVYGNTTTANCTVPQNSMCSGQREFPKMFICRFCYQTEHWEHTCVEKANCNAVASPRHYYRSNCTVHDHIICLGRRTFHKNLLCNWTGGYRWSTALILSFTLGGFGADRFYLGHWQEGIGKLFSFGGLGVWTLIDVLLIGLRYLGPADGSLYI